MTLDVDNAPPVPGLPVGKRVLSGIQPSGALHLGVYFGAMRQHVAFHGGNDCVYFIADYHSMTTLRDPARRRALTRHVALAYLALGIDPARAILYRQSDVPEVHDLAWLLSTVTPMGLLQRAHAYKDKVEHGIAADHGLFAYPVLMAADVLIHRPDYVPVGEDQRQHVEMTRDMAGKLNLVYGDVLELPRAFILRDVAVVPGTDGRKMSKTYGNTIEIFAPEPQLRKQVMGIVTDSTPVEAPKDAKLPLFQIWRLLATPEERDAMEVRCREGGQGYGDVKKDLFERLLGYFAPARRRYAELEPRPDTVEDVLRDGARRSRERAVPLIEAARRAAGLGPPIE